MIRQSTYNIILFLACFVFLSNECGNEKAFQDENTMEANAIQLNRDFENDTLPGVILNSFNERARQKLSDFSDYLNVYADKSLDTIFRQQAGQMIVDLFVPGSVRLRSLIDVPGKEFCFGVEDFLWRFMEVQYNSVKTEITSIWIADPLHQTGPFEYQGQLNFMMKIKGIQGSDTVTLSEPEMKIKIIVSKRNKKFGNEEKNIWNVLLGEMDKISSEL